MKNIRNIGMGLLIAGGLLFTACDVEPVDGALLTNNGGNTGGGNTGGGNTGGGNTGGGNTGGGNITGTYLMTAFNTSVPTDLNGDGTPSTNQMNETNCFNNSLLVLNANNTFTASSNGIDIVSDGVTETMECFTDPNLTGTWTLTGTTLSLTYTDEGETYTDNYTVSGSTITASVEEGQVVGTANDGSPVYLTATISIVYTKQ
ncbi:MULTISPECIES: lipocalin family protein [Flavobacterium]|uniref:lipocalin family protein n=1 Tax=Flavobacterium TaxID=237 RepID=UPI0015AE9EDF|nr:MULTISPECIES: lipocalin family protein [Flavobacterium]